VSTLYVEGFAQFSSTSESELFRYVLRRKFTGVNAPLRLCVWMNPSTADDKTDDASIRIGMSYARRWGDGGIVVINVMDLVLTDSRKLPKDQRYATGALHWPYVDGVLAGQYGDLRKEVLCGWGDAGAGEQADRMLHRLRMNGYVPCTLGLTKSGNPGHPLRKSLALPLVPFGAALRTERYEDQQ
jgi:hypothetical protein